MNTVASTTTMTLVIVTSAFAFVAPPVAGTPLEGPSASLGFAPEGTSCTITLTKVIGECTFSCNSGDRITVSAASLGVAHVTGSCGGVSASCTTHAAGGCKSTSTETTSEGTGTCVAVTAGVGTATCSAAP